MSRRAGVVTVVLFAVASGCAPASSTGAPGIPPTAATAQPATIAPATGEAPTVPAASPEASALGLDEWTSTQLFLLAGLEPKFRVTCAPTSVLPKGASDGIDCKPEGIETMGVYAFTERGRMQRLYLSRLGEYNVKADSGDGCQDGRPGEVADSPDFGWGPDRIGCYVDESGDANVRMIFPSRTDDLSVYIGVVGRTGNIDDLMRRLFPDYAPGSLGCTWCTSNIWSLPGE